MSTRALPVRAIGAAIAMFAVVAPAPRSGAAPASACTTTSGVTVIVDFTHFGRDIERGCAPGHPVTALEAVHAAGFDTAGTAQYGDAFVCRVNGLPSTTKESCARTPPASSSWSFYSARPTDADWTYSSAGVLSFQPRAGTILALAFGNHAKPGVRPSGAIVGPPTTTPAPAVTTTPAPTTAPVATQGRVTTVPAAPDTTAVVTTTTTGTTITRSPTPVPAASTTTTGATPLVIHSARRQSSIPHDGAGSPLPVVLTAVLVAMLGIGGGLAVRARRRRPA